MQKQQKGNDMSVIMKNTPTLALSALLALLAFADVSRAELTVYETDNKGDSQNQPPKDPNGGNGWLPATDSDGVSVSRRGIDLDPGKTIWLACNNNLDHGVYKRWTLTLTSTGEDAELDDQHLGLVQQSGYDEKNSPVFSWNATGIDPLTHARKLYLCFRPQPAWERVALKNIGTTAIGFTIESTTTCNDFQVAANTLEVPTCLFGAVGPGVMVANQLINTVMVFPQTVALNPATPPTFSAPASSGQWTASAVYEDPNGNFAPLGGVLYTCNGPGLAPGQPCSFTFAMQGPAADMQYKMYAYDSVLQEFQDFNWDLRPWLNIAPSNNSIGLQFGTVLGETYTVLSSPDLHTWQPIHSFAGTGDVINWQTPMNGGTGFFRVSCLPSPIPTNRPAVIGISGPASSSGISITFSEPVDSLTAVNPANYFLVGGSHTIPIQGVSPLGSRAVQLSLASPLMTGTNYILGVSGVADPAGHVMLSATFPFLAVSLQTPCPGGELLSKQTYSECNADGFWHVVEDDYYLCPPNGAMQKFRVADTATTQHCGPTQTPPNPVGLFFPTDADVVTTCQSPVFLGQVSVCECLGGLWSVDTYLQYQCLDGTIYMSGPVLSVPMNPPTPCNQPPPPAPPNPH
jgi:hypothetical protein